MSPRAASTFEIYPAIDLRDGRVVRLRQGDFDREQVYGVDPAAVAREFAAAGARWIHVVDLDGAKSGARRQVDTVGTVVDAVRSLGASGRDASARCRVQVAGGLRTAEAIADALDRGADRVVLGTVALQDPAFVAEQIRVHGVDRIAVALDVRDGMAVGQGWVPGATEVPLGLLEQQLTAVGVDTFLVTAIARDGLLGGPDLALLESCVGATTAAVIASGGISALGDLVAVRAIGCSGAIVGRALYDGVIDLTSAIETLG